MSDKFDFAVRVYIFMEFIWYSLLFQIISGKLKSYGHKTHRSFTDIFCIAVL